MTVVAAPRDIIPETRDIALGTGWYPLEVHRGQSFRWVENDAVVNVAVLRPVRHVLRLLVEPGPGVGLKPFELTARLADGTRLAAVTVAGKQRVEIDLPPESPRALSVVLHAETGGKADPKDPRVLNFRLFEIAVEHRPDVMPAWARPQKSFYPLETFAGSMFRWVSNDALIALDRERGSALVFEAEPGPGLDSRPFTLHVLRPDGSEVTTAKIGSRTRVSVPMKDLADVASLTLHVDGGGKAIADDPRVLNFRIFAAE